MAIIVCTILLAFCLLFMKSRSRIQQNKGDIMQEQIYEKIRNDPQTTILDSINMPKQNFFMFNQIHSYIPCNAELNFLRPTTLQDINPDDLA